MNAPIVSIDDYFAGQRAYLNHEDCPADASEDFKRGYAVEYERGEVNTWLSEQGVRRGSK
jgi:hypothetical protein